MFSSSQFIFIQNIIFVVSYIIVDYFFFCFNSQFNRMYQEHSRCCRITDLEVYNFSNSMHIAIACNNYIIRCIRSYDVQHEIRQIPSRLLSSFKTVNRLAGWNWNRAEYIDDSCDQHDIRAHLFYRHSSRYFYSRTLVDKWEKCMCTVSLDDWLKTMRDIEPVLYCEQLIKKRSDCTNARLKSLK